MVIYYLLYSWDENYRECYYDDITTESPTSCVCHKINWSMTMVHSPAPHNSMRMREREYNTSRRQKEYFIYSDTLSDLIHFLSYQQNLCQKYFNAAFFMDRTTSCVILITDPVHSLFQTEMITPTRSGSIRFPGSSWIEGNFLPSIQHWQLDIRQHFT